MQGGTAANGNSGVSFVLRYFVTLTDRGTGRQCTRTSEFQIEAPVTQAARKVPAIDASCYPDEGAYDATIVSEFWKQTGNQFTWFQTAETTVVVGVRIKSNAGVTTITIRSRPFQIHLWLRRLKFG